MQNLVNQYRIKEMTLAVLFVRNKEATGSIPVSSTNLLNNFTCLEDRFAL